jgi:hypothetical protein
MHPRCPMQSCSPLCNYRLMYRCILILVTAIACLPAHSAERPELQKPPVPPSPIEHFRKLLSMSPEEREKAMLARSPKTRELLEAKLQEYQALPPAEREDRLRTLELRWYLLPLMKDGATNRAARLQMIPERERSLIAERLRWWDKFSPAEQQDLLASEPAINSFARPETPLSSGPVTLSRITPQEQERIARSSEYLSSLPADKREKIYRRFQEFFELSEREKTKALDSFSEAERKRMERTLNAFEKLPPQERDRCIAGFEKFQALSPAEQAHFLKSAERWHAMSKKDRDIWRNLVNRKAMPPMPPGFPNPAAALKPAELEVATNR